MVSRNLERANENDGFKMTALEYGINGIVGLKNDRRTCERVCFMLRKKI